MHVNVLTVFVKTELTLLVNTKGKKVIYFAARCICHINTNTYYDNGVTLSQKHSNPDLLI